MDLTGEQIIQASQQQVWDALNDPAVLKACIEGCESLAALDGNRFEGIVAAAIGPVKARFSGLVTLSDLDPPNSYTISGEGKGGAAGFAKGGAQVRLSPDGGATRLSYTVRAQVGGKLAQIGARLVDAAAQKYAESFFTRFRTHVEGLAGQSSAPEPAAPPMTEAAGLPEWVWIAGILALTALVLGWQLLT